MEDKRVTGSNEIDQAKEELRSNKTKFIDNNNNNIDNNNFNIFYTNADCFTNKRDDLANLLGTLGFKPDIIVITEINSKCASNNLLINDFNLVGFNLFPLNVSVVGKRGILIYVNDCLHSVQLDFAQAFDEYLFIKSESTPDLVLL